MKRLGVIILSLILCGAAALAEQPTTESPAPKHGSGLPKSTTTKYDTHLPIEISSDTLEVLQHENKAIFRGNVVAVQGQLRLKSDVMIVHYKQKKDDTAAGKPKPVEPSPQPKPDANAAAGQGAMGAITRIEVAGDVFMASPEESARGDTGDYDVDSKTIHLFGSNVILTRDKNILRGTALEYNLETGRSLLTNGSDVVNGKQTGGRVRGVFVPNQEPAKQQKPSKPAQAQQTGQVAPVQGNR